MDMQNVCLCFRIENNNKLIPWTFNDLEFSRDCVHVLAEKITTTTETKISATKPTDTFVWAKRAWTPTLPFHRAIYAMIISSAKLCHRFGCYLFVGCWLLADSSVIDVFFLSLLLSLIPIHSDILSCGWHFLQRSINTALNIRLSFVAYTWSHGFERVAVRKSITKKRESI